MQSIFHSVFLQALGYAIANSLWQMALLWLVLWLLTIIIKPTAANKYRIAVASQITGFAWFIVTLQFYFIKCSDALQINTTLHPSANITFIVPDTGNSYGSWVLNSIIRSEQLLPILSCAYLSLLIILLTRWAINYNSIQHIRSKGLINIGIEWETFIQKIAAQLGITKNIRIYVSELISGPLTVGFIKPIILIPVASINHLSTQQLEAVLLHELAHIKRYDYLLNLFLSITEIILFFNPFTQSISHHIKRERENSCDDWVLQFQYNPAMYAEALLQIANLSNKPYAVLSMNAAPKKGELLPRIKRLIGSNDNQFTYSHQLLTLLLITGILSSVAWFHPAANYQKKTASSTPKSQQVIIAPMAAKVDNPLFNPVFFLQKPLKLEVEKSMKLSAESLAASANAMKQADEAVTTAIPAAMQEVDKIDFEKLGNDVEKSLRTIDLKKMQSSDIRFNETALKREMQLAFDKNFATQFEKMAVELKKAKIAIDKTMHNKKMIALDETKLQEELYKSFASLENADIPFIRKIREQVNRQLLNNLRIKIDSIRTEKINLQQKVIKDIAEMDMSDEELLVNVPTKQILLKNNASKKDDEQADIKNRQVKHYSVTIPSKHEEIIIAYEEN